MGDTATETRLLSKVLVEMERIGVSAGGGEAFHVAVRNGLGELEPIADGQFGWVVGRQFGVPLGQVFVGRDAVSRRGNGAVLFAWLDAKCGEGSPVCGHDTVEYV